MRSVGGDLAFEPMPVHPRLAISKCFRQTPASGGSVNMVRKVLWLDNDPEYIAPVVRLLSKGVGVQMARSVMEAEKEVVSFPNLVIET